jgi:5-methylcytosine-specific restriction endonuclease McrA
MKLQLWQNLLGDDYQIDHILPIFKGGTNDMDNGQALCTWCHDLKTSEETSERIAWKKVEKRPRCENEPNNRTSDETS